MKEAGKMLLVFLVAITVGGVITLTSSVYGDYRPLCWEQWGNCSGTAGCDPKTEYCGHIDPTSDRCDCRPLQ